MKTKLVTSVSILACAVALSAFGQDPTPPPSVPVPSAAVAQPTPSVAGSTPSPSATVLEETALERKIKDKVKRHVQVTFGDDDDRDRDRNRRNRDRDRHDFDVDDGALMAIPIVGIIFTTLFGAPVLVVGLIMFFSYWKARSLHKTVREMVAKGQEVPAALFAGPPPVVRARSDMRRGVVLVMVGVGMMIFFGAMDDWDGGAWALGVIPFLIGAGYLLVWKLEGNKPSTDNTARLP
ncbi:MAG: DUF6249 domain-containing protein [Verrucomicrobiota bacterium]|nr:DUF6249 domain-containing protein [Verrucomicrobiota bacterium]